MGTAITSDFTDAQINTMMKLTLVVLAVMVVSSQSQGIIDTVSGLIPKPCMQDADCAAGTCCQRVSLGKRNILDNGICTTVSVAGEHCYIHGSCGCASGLKCIQDDLFFDILNVNPVGTCGVPSA